MLLQQALVHHRRGELALAEPLYRKILADVPAHFDALHFLGVVATQQGRHEEAARLIGRAIEENPHHTAAYTNLGLVLRKLGRVDEALASYDRALALQPDSAEALNNRGNALVDLKRYEEALASYDRTLALKPDYVVALKNRGDVLADLQRPAAALASYDRALALQSDYVPALKKRGDVLVQLQRHAEAIASYDRALARQPDFAEALNNRGSSLLQLRRDEEALASFDRALAVQPDYPEALSNRGNALARLQRHEEALGSYDRALALHPDSITALNNRGNALVELKRYDDALASYDRALALAPRYVDFLNRLADAPLDPSRHGRVPADHAELAELLSNRGNVLRDLKRHGEAARCFAQLVALAPGSDSALGSMVHCQLHVCDWKGMPESFARVEAAALRGERAAGPFDLLAISASAPAQFECARAYAAHRFTPSAPPMWAGERYRHDRIRVAYLSADFHEHAVAVLIAGLFEQHDRKRFDVAGVSFGPPGQDAMRSRLAAGFERFIDVRGMSDAGVGTLLREMEIDIVVDLMGYTKDARTDILACRPAPVQVNYLGYPGTMGTGFIDYIVADGYVIPAGDDGFYAENIVRLPDSYQVNDARRRIAQRTPLRAELGLPEDAFVFCCFNNAYKITPQIFDVWMRLLGKVPGSVLWLLEDSAPASDNLRREAEKRAIAPERLVFAPRMNLDEHLARHRRADLFVDTLPYNAHTTASDALWAGLPVLTCSGSAFPGRVAGSLLCAAGLPELITHSLAEYEELAVKLAATPSLLSGLRARLARDRDACPLFDTDRFRRHLESAYVEMWERAQRGEPPAGFSVRSA